MGEVAAGGAFWSYADGAVAVGEDPGGVDVVLSGKHATRAVRTRRISRERAARHGAATESCPRPGHAVYHPRTPALDAVRIATAELHAEPARTRYTNEAGVAGRGAVAGLANRWSRSGRRGALGVAIFGQCAAVGRVAPTLRQDRIARNLAGHAPVARAGHTPQHRVANHPR